DFLGVAFDREHHVAVTLRDLANTEVVTVTAGESLAEALRRIDYFDFEQLPVVDRPGGTRVIGTLSRRAIMGTYERMVLERALKS
ncbi:CBS domain-containing protein, partial [Geobacter sp.]|uniref:CBS domain-containing protein n=1 Tax=Geobacter sp. TaxID=46610 RepID=UPI002628605F